MVWFWFQGLENEYQEEGQLLGQFVFDQDGESLQTFPVPVSSSASATGPCPLASAGPADLNRTVRRVRAGLWGWGAEPLALFPEEPLWDALHSLYGQACDDLLEPSGKGHLRPGPFLSDVSVGKVTGLGRVCVE